MHRLAFFTFFLCNLSAAQELIFIDTNTRSLPWMKIENDQITQGFIKDSADAIAAQLGYTAKVKAFPRKRLPAILNAGQADLLCFMRPEWITADVNWSDTMAWDADAIVTRRNTPAIKQISDLKHQAVNTVLGYSYPEIEKVLTEDFVRFDGLSEDISLINLTNGRNDFAVLSETYYRYQLKTHPQRANLNTNYLLIGPKAPLRCALAKKSTLKIEQLNQALDQLNKNRTLENIYNRYR